MATSPRISQNIGVDWVYKGITQVWITLFSKMGGGLGDLGWERPGLNGWGVLEVSLESWGGGGWEFLFGNFLCFYHDVGPLPTYLPLN